MISNYKKSLSFAISLIPAVFSSLLYADNSQSHDDASQSHEMCDCDDSTTIQPMLETEIYIEFYYAAHRSLVPVVGYEYTQEFSVDVPEAGDAISYDGFGGEFLLRVGNGFIETRDRGLYGPLSQFKFGYHLENSEKRQTSLLFGSSRPSYSPGDQAGFESIQFRESDTLIGIRNINYFGEKHQLEFALFKETGNDAGFQANTTYERFGQIGKLGIEGSVGLTFLSSQYNNFYYGVSRDEVSDQVPSYSTGSAFHANASLHAAWPLKPNVFFQLGGDYERFADNTADSPLVAGKNAYRLRAGLSWVFSK